MTYTNNWNEADISDLLLGVADAELSRDLTFRVYTSQLIGQQPDLVMHSGDNNSCKTVTTDL